MDNRIYLEKYTSQEDYESFSKIALNEYVMTMNYGEPLPEEIVKMIFSYMLEANNVHKDFGNFKVLHKDNDEVIGFGCIKVNEDLTEGELEYMLLPEYWGKGYGSELVDNLLSKIKHIDSITQVVANVGPMNIGSKKILLKNGFILRKIFENADNGSPVELFIKSI